MRGRRHGRLKVEIEAIQEKGPVQSRDLILPALIYLLFSSSCSLLVVLHPNPYLIHYTMVPPNVHVSSHPCLRAKLSQLRSQSSSTRDTRSLVNEIATILGVEAFSVCFKSAKSGTVSCNMLPVPD